MLTAFTLGALLVALVIQPAILRRWPALARYSLPPSTRPRIADPLPWEIVLEDEPPAEPERAQPAPPMPKPSTWVEQAMENRLRRATLEIEHQRAQMRAMQNDAGRQYREALRATATGYSQYHSQTMHYAEPTTDAPAGATFDPARNCYRFADGLVEIDADYWASLTAHQRAQLVPSQT